MDLGVNKKKTGKVSLLVSMCEHDLMWMWVDFKRCFIWYWIRLLYRLLYTVYVLVLFIFKNPEISFLPVRQTLPLVQFVRKLIFDVHSQLDTFQQSRMAADLNYESKVSIFDELEMDTIYITFNSAAIQKVPCFLVQSNDSLFKQKYSSLLQMLVLPVH